MKALMPCSLHFFIMISNTCMESTGVLPSSLQKSGLIVKEESLLQEKLFTGLGLPFIHETMSSVDIGKRIMLIPRSAISVRQSSASALQR